MQKTYNDVRSEYLRFKEQFPDDPTDITGFAKQMDQIEGQPVRQSAYTTGVIKQADAAIDRGFELTHLPQLAGAAGGYVGGGIDSLLGTHIAPVVENLGRDTPRMIAEAMLTIPEAVSGAGVPAAGAMWANRARKIAGYLSSAAGGVADTDSLLGGVISAGSLGLGNKLLSPVTHGGWDVGGQAAGKVLGALEKASPDIVASEGANMLAERPIMSAATKAQQLLPLLARVGADAATMGGLNEATRQAHLSVGPNRVGITDEARNPFTQENVAGNVMGAIPFVPAAISGYLGRPRLVPKQVEQIKGWNENRQKAKEAYRGYDWEGPIDPVTWQDTFGTLEGAPAFRGKDLVPVEDYWHAMGQEKLIPDAGSEESRKSKYGVMLRGQLDAYYQQVKEGDQQLATYTKQSIANLLEAGDRFGQGEEFATHVKTTMDKIDTEARMMPPEDVKGLSRFVQDLNTLIDDINENSSQFTEEQKSPEAKGKTWHPEARSSLVTDRLQKKKVIEPVTEEWLKKEFNAEFDQSGDPQFAYQTVLQKAANKVLDAVPAGLAAEKALGEHVQTEQSPKVLAAMAKNDLFVDALNGLPDEVRDSVIERTAEIFKKPSFISTKGNTAGRLVDQVGSWRNAVISAFKSYDPETQTILRRKAGGGYERAPISSLTLRDEHGDYIWNPVSSAVAIGEGGKPKKVVGGKQVPETNIEDLPQGQSGISDEAFDEDRFKEVLATEGIGGSLQTKETAGLGEGKAGLEKTPEMGTTEPDFLSTPVGKATGEALTSKKDKVLKTMKSLSDDQLYAVARDAFVTRSSVGLPVKDLFEPTRKKLFRTAMMAALEDLQNKGEVVGPSGKRFLAMVQETGKGLTGSGERKQLANALRDIFKFKTPVKDGPEGVPAHYARMGEIVNYLLDDKRVDAVRSARMSPGTEQMTPDEVRALISDDIDPKDVVSEGDKPTIFYHGTKTARGVPLDPSELYKTTSLSTKPEVANTFGSLATYPVLVKAGKYFDYLNADHRALLKDFGANPDHPDLINGYWGGVEKWTYQIKKLGFDGFWTDESARNLHVYDPKKQLVYIPDTKYLKKGEVPKKDDLFVNTQPDGSFPKDVAKTFRFHFNQIFGQSGLSGTMRDLYTDMATAIALQLDGVPTDFYTLQSREWGLAKPEDGRGKIGINFQRTEGDSGVKFANRVLATLAHEISHIDAWVLSGVIGKPDAFSEYRKRSLENVHALANILSVEEREAMITVLKDAMVPKEYQYDLRDPVSGKMYGTEDPHEFVSTINEFVALSLVGGKSQGKILSALEVLDYGPTEVREFARGTYRAFNDILLGMKEVITNPHAMAEFGKSLPNINQFVTSEAFHTVLNSVRDASSLRQADHALSQARSLTASLSQGAATALPMSSPAQWFRTAKDIHENFTAAKAMPAELPVSATEALEQATDFLNRKSYDKTTRPGVWARWFYPFANLMVSMDRSGVPLARPVWNLAENLETGVSRTRSRILSPFLIQGTDGQYHFDADNVLIAKVAKEATGPWRKAVDAVSVWQQENGTQSMFVKNAEGIVGVNEQLPGAKEAWEKIRKNLTPADQQMVQATSVALDRTSQNAAEELVVSIDKSNRHRTARLLMAMNKGMTYDKAMALADTVVGGYLQNNVLGVQSLLSPAQFESVQSLLAGPEGLIAKFDEVQKKLLSRPGFRTESLPGDYIVRFRKPGIDGEEGKIAYLSADTEHKAVHLARKLTNEGNTIEGEIVHKKELTNYTDFDAPDTILQKFMEVEGGVWDRVVKEIEAKHGTEIAEELKAYAPGAKTLKELGTKGMGKFLTERKSLVDRERYDYIDGTMSWAGRLASSIAMRETRAVKDLILADPRAKSFPSFKPMVEDHFANLMEPTSQLSKELKSMTTGYMLGGSLASAVVEGTQSATTLVPIMISLNKEGGPVKAWRQLSAAIADATWVTMSKDWEKVAAGAEKKDPAELTKQEHLALTYRRATEDGGVNHGVIEDLLYGRDQKMLMAAKFGHGDYGPVSIGEMARNKLYLGSQMMMRVYSWMSVFNNKISLLAGAAQAFDQGLRGEQAYDHAKLVKTLSTFGGGKANVPGLVPKLSTPYTRSAVGVVNALQQYGYGSVATYAQLAKDSLGMSSALSPEQRRQAQKAFGTMLATQVAVSGALGLPFAGASLALLEQIFGLPANQLVRQGLASLGTNEDQGAVIAETALNGIGNQMFGLDVSSRLGVSTILGTSSYKGFNLADMAGPAGSIVGNMAKSLNLFSQGEVMKGAKELVPNAFKTLVEMSDTQAKYGDSGMRDQGGNLLYTPTPSQAAAYMIGFRPRELSQKRQAQKLMTFANKQSTVQRDKVLDGSAEALLRGDSATALREAQNAKYADPTVDAQAMLRSIVNRAVDSTTEKDLLASGPAANEGERRSIAGTFGSGVVTRQSEIQRAQLAAQLGARLGLAPNPKTFERAALVDSLVQSRGMPRSQALRLVEFLH